MYFGLHQGCSSTASDSTSGELRHEVKDKFAQSSVKWFGWRSVNYSCDAGRLDLAANLSGKRRSCTHVWVWGGDSDYDLTSRNLA